MSEQELKIFFKEKVETWYDPLKQFLHSDAFMSIGRYINVRSKETIVMPSPDRIFRAFHLTKWDEVRVVIINQDPYPASEYASGIAFGIDNEFENLFIPYPASLQNILDEVENDLYNGLNFPDYTLESWCKQGVLMLNAALTVENGIPGSHVALWDPFTKEVVKAISNNKPGTIWLLWGEHAQTYKPLINLETNHVLECGSPNPHSVKKGLWFNNKHFSETNAILEKANGTKFKIKW
jgi:uracil-DNA glycosylase